MTAISYIFLAMTQLICLLPAGYEAGSFLTAFKCRPYNTIQWKICTQKL